MIFTGALFVLGFAISGVTAQSGTSSAIPTAAPSGITTCIINCSTQAAASGGCSSFTELSCVCTSTAFQDAASACLQANCTSAEQQAALQLQSQECASITSGSASATATSPASSASSVISSAVSGTSSIASGASSSASSAASSASSAASSSSAAGGRVELIGRGGVMGVLVAFSGIVAGMVLVL
ncbi:uncharacterized protein STEHIDRAFT_150951 [Stereum hirsutum FP-91666 SS1]|uniref:CFEM domain-containing protein n=1 Tax=Stereum hirsutum (strain FP-91666) TaxID=721885 RepID=R7RX76_STEHR|nr:uncharacterized protein STEHIDRAFT_150951 [Stereum hirsutum FP-91666 SS1]EIM79465.1 hypothetical protein STEHIDRAFT_150951 [Stereum hirsutum FP-91666 SS1]